jgi:probable F420-dependent oxidoreductase
MMEIGVTFPFDGLRNDPVAMRDFAQAAEALGYAHIQAADHVLGRDDLGASARPIIDPFLLFSHLAAVTSRIRLVSGIMVLPQRQTALVARQTANLDVLCGGRLQLAFGVGSSAPEYEALNEDFHNRGRRMDEQLELLRLMWTQDGVDFHGKYHTIDRMKVNPLPIQRPIPIWMAGYADSALRRIARFADGWVSHSPPGVAPGAGPEIIGPALERVRAYVVEAGRDVSQFGLSATIRTAGKSPGEWRAALEPWRAVGATQMSINTAMPEDPWPVRHIDAIRRFAEEILAAGKS